MHSVEYEYNLETFNTIWPKTTLETYHTTLEIINLLLSPMYILSFLGDFRYTLSHNFGTI
jgi:hypothetical protein